MMQPPLGPRRFLQLVPAAVGVGWLVLAALGAHRALQPPAGWRTQALPTPHGR